MSLYENIHKKRASGRKMKKKGAKGAPSAQDFKNAANNWKDFKCDVDRVVKEEKLPAHIMRLVKWRFSNPPTFKYVEEHIGCITYFKKMEVK